MESSEMEYWMSTAIIHILVGPHQCEATGSRKPPVLGRKETVSFNWSLHSALRTPCEDMVRQCVRVK